MARQQVFKTLPTLVQALGTFSGFPPKQSKQAFLTDELRKLAKRYRTKAARPFYTMRDVGTYYGLPLQTVGKAYERLELEGLLNRIRGSKTLLAGKSSSLGRPVRGVVGLPVLLHSMMISPYARALYIELEERLRVLGYVADLIFYQSHEQTEPEFAERILMHKLDVVIWHGLQPMAVQNVLRLADTGIRQILVRSVDSTTSLNLPTYLLDWRKAYRQLGEEWRKSGVKMIYVPDPVSILSKRGFESFRTQMEHQGLEIGVLKGTAQAILDKITQNADQLSGVAFLDQTAGEGICSVDPHIVEQILVKARVAFCRGPIRVPYLDHRGVVADFICLSAHEVADRLATDIQQNIPFTGFVSHTFHAEFRPRLSFSEFQTPLPDAT